MRKDAGAKLLAILLVFSGGAQAEGSPEMSKAEVKQPVIRVTGSATVEAKPDIARLVIGVTTEDANAQNAVAANTSAIAKVIAELEAAPIAKKDIQTSHFSVYPQHRVEGADKRQVKTFQVSNSVIVTIRDLDKAGDILAKAAAAGSNQINGPHFSVSDPEKYLAEARKKAVENAMAKARTFAEAAGLKLGAVLEIVEESAAGQLYPARSYAAARTGGPVPIEAGEESLRAEVLLVIELKP